jgi:transposase
MHKASSDVAVSCGIDVSAKELVAVVVGSAVQRRVFANRGTGHRSLIRWLHDQASSVRVCLEATGLYSLDVALALHNAEGIEIAVLNPKTVHRFATTLCRSKTDPADARALAEYARRMPFTAWRPPSETALRLRAMTRYVTQLLEQQSMQTSRLHAAMASTTVPICVRQDLRSSLRNLQHRIVKLRRQALSLVQQTPELQQRFRLLVSAPGIAEISALHLLGELILLPNGLQVRQWVAYSGLDPQHHESGTSAHHPARISRSGNRYLRRALFMPALVSARRDPHFRSFYTALAHRHKNKMQALIAVARQLLHAIFGMFRSGLAFDGQLLFPTKKVLPTPLSKENLLAT